MKLISSIIVFLFFSLNLFAQNPDSIKVPAKAPVAEYFLEKDFFPNNSSYKSIDTSLNGIHKYFPNNFPYSLGLANRKLNFEPSSDIGFRSGFDNLDLFGYNMNEIKYYRTRTPYTEIFALFGQKKEQYARLLHTQNVTKQWNIALNMLRLRNGDGFYNRQNCTDNNISLSSNFTSKNNRYSFLANGIISSIKTDENGGVNDTVFENNLFVNKKLIPVNLLEARTRRGNRGAQITQFLNFGKRDTLKKDSTARSGILPNASLSYSFGVNENWFVYEDKNPSSGFYSNIFYDSTLTYDSSHVFSFQNNISWKQKIAKIFEVGISCIQRNSHLIQFSDSAFHEDTILFNRSINFELKNVKERPFEQTHIKIGGEYFLNADNKNDYKIYFDADGWLEFKNRTIADSALMYFELNSTKVPFIYSIYSSNHFLWRKSFNNVSKMGGNIIYKNLKHNFSIGFESYNINGYVYFDSTFSPTQFDDTFNISSAFIQKNFHLKHFNFNNKITWQQASEDVIHLPEFVTHHSLFYQGKWFKKAVDIQFGFDVTYFTSYYADAYMPALGLYYWQNEKKIGNYPFIDFFFNMKVKHARIFFKTEHVNSGLMGVYYLAPHNPAPDRSIKVGINWTFYD